MTSYGLLCCQHCLLLCQAFILVCVGVPPAHGYVGVLHLVVSTRAEAVQRVFHQVAHAITGAATLPLLLPLPEEGQEVEVRHQVAATHPSNLPARHSAVDLVCLTGNPVGGQVVDVQRQVVACPALPSQVCDSCHHAGLHVFYHSLVEGSVQEGFVWVCELQQAQH